MKQWRNPRLMLMASTAVFGTLGIFVRNIPVSSGELALYRAILASLMIALYLTVSHQKIPFGAIRKEIPFLLLSGAAMGINWILLFEAYRYTTVSAATLSYYFAPVLVTVLCPFLFHEKMTPRQILCFVMSTSGLILITDAGGSGCGTDFIGILLGLCAAVFYAAVILLNKFIRNVEGLHRTFLQFIAAAAVLIPYVAVTGGVTLNRMTSAGWISLLIVGFFHTGLTYCMYFSSLSRLPGQTAAVLSYIDPLVAVLVSVTVLHEPLSFRQAAGGALILGFTLLNELSPDAKQ